MSEADYFNYLSELFKGSKHVIIHYAEDLHKYSIEVGTAPQKVVSWVYNSNTAKQHRAISFYGVKPDFRKVGQEYKNPKDKRIQKRIAEGKKARLYDWWEINQVKNVSAEKTEHPCQTLYNSNNAWADPWQYSHHSLTNIFAILCLFSNLFAPLFVQRFLPISA